MKAPAFWYRAPSTASALLTPLSWSWRTGTAIRRAFATPYHGVKPIICIGNIVAGGAGKTPTAIAIARILQDAHQNPVIVSRGYGGNQTGPLQVDPGRHTAREVGDEALLLASVAPVWIGQDREETVRQAEKQASHVILDDGLQNPHIRPDLAFLVVDLDVGLGNGRVIPAGPLRETFTNAMKRITAVILIGSRDDQRIAMRVQCPMIRARWRPLLPEDFPKTEKFYAFAGIGRPEKFFATARAAGLDLAATTDFADHHFYGAHEIARLRKKALAQDARLLTTEKDYVRLPQDLRAGITPFPAVLEFDQPETILRLLNLSK